MNIVLRTMGENVKSEGRVVGVVGVTEFDKAPSTLFIVFSMFCDNLSTSFFKVSVTEFFEIRFQIVAQTLLISLIGYQTYVLKELKELFIV